MAEKVSKAIQPQDKKNSSKKNSGKGNSSSNNEGLNDLSSHSACSPSGHQGSQNFHKKKPYTINRPFRRAPSQGKPYLGGGGRPKVHSWTEVQQAVLASSQQGLHTRETEVSLLSTHSPSPLPFAYISLENIPRAGRLKYFLQNWELLTSDQWTLNTVRGYRLELTGRPRQLRLPFPHHLNPTQLAVVEDEITSLLDKKAIVSVPHLRKLFYSNLFLVEKKGGGQRPVINLSSLNSFVRHHHFEMEDLKLVADILRPQDIMCNIDLKDAYFAVSIHPEHQKLLCFKFQNVTYHFKCLPFGLTSAPRVFTKVLKSLVAFVRRLGRRICIYIDDMLILNSPREGALRAASLMIHLLETLGFTVNMEKSILFPSQEMEFLGVLVNFVHMSFSLPDRKVVNLQKECRRLLSSKTASQWDLAHLIGKMIAAKAAVFQAPLHYRALQHQKNSLDIQRVPLHRKVILDVEALLDMEWWVNNLPTANRPVKPLLPNILIQSDASGLGWGAVCNRIETRGTWSLHESSLHINCLKLLAATYAIKAFLHQILEQCSCSNTNGQYISHSLSKQNGGSQTGCSRQACTHSLGMVSEQENLPSSRAHSGSTECHSRCRVLSKARCSRLEARFRGVPSSESEFRSFYNRHFCQQEQCSAGEILQLSARSSNRTVRCSSSALDGGKCLHLPPFQLDQQMSEEDKPRRSNTVDCLSGVASAAMVPPPSIVVVKQSSISSN